MANTIFVKSGLKTDQVALWEVDARHPGGEVYVTGIDNDKANPPVVVKPVEVFKTSLVMKYLGEGRLVEATGKGIQQIKVESPKGA
jgi:hypothetical protein